MVAASATAPGKLGGTYNVGFTGPFAGVDPHNSVYGGAGIVPQVYDYLVRTSIIAPELGVIPQLATKWETSGDQLTTVFTLRPDSMITANTQNVPVRLDIEQGGLVIATPFQGQLGIGPHTLDWDGKSNGVALPDGDYIAVLTVSDQLGDVQLSLPLTIDTTAPVLSIVDAHALKFTLDEPATVTILVNQKQRIVRGEGKGTFTIAVQGVVYQLSAEAQDLAGNISEVVTGP